MGWWAMIIITSVVPRPHRLRPRRERRGRLLGMAANDTRSEARSTPIAVLHCGLFFGLPDPDRIPLRNRIGFFDRRRRDRIINLPIWTGDSNRGIDQEPFVSKIASVRRYSNTREIIPLPWELIANAGHFVRDLAKHGKH